MKKTPLIVLCCGILAAVSFAAPPFVTPAMMKRNGLTDEQYELLWKQGKNPQIDVATARDWIFRASRYANVVEWLETLGKTNDFAALSHRLQGDNFALTETNRTQRVEIRRLDALASSYSNAWKRAEFKARSLEERAARLDALRAYLIQKRDEAKLPTTKAIYQSLIDRIDVEDDAHHYGEIAYGQAFPSARMTDEPVPTFAEAWRRLRALVR